MQMPEGFLQRTPNFPGRLPIRHILQQAGSIPYRKAQRESLTEEQERRIELLERRAQRAVERYFADTAAVIHPCSIQQRLLCDGHADDSLFHLLVDREITVTGYIPVNALISVITVPIDIHFLSPLENDYQQTWRFQNYITNRLENFLSIAVNGCLDDWYYYASEYCILLPHPAGLVKEQGGEGAVIEGIRCGMKPTSCPDQLAQALKAAR